MTPSRTDDARFFQRHYHDCVIASLAFGSDIEIGLRRPSGEPVLLRLEDVVLFRANGVMETNIVVAISFEPLRALTAKAFVSILRRLDDSRDDKQLTELLVKRRDYGMLSIDQAMGLSGIGVCRRVIER